MNKTRRTRLEEINEKLNDIMCWIEEIKDEEQEAYDNLPESLQYSDKGCQMEENVSDLENVYDEIVSLISAIDDIIYK